MTTSRLIRAPLWATLLIAVVAAMVSYFVFVPSSEGAPAGDKPTYEPQIINGEPVPNGKYPFMAALLDKSLPGNSASTEQICGGTLIDKTHILTAGHCVFSARRTGPPVLDPKLQDLKVVVGRTVLSSNQGYVRSVKDIDVHPKYPGNPGTPDIPGNPQSYDVAVLTLSIGVKGIKPIELASSDQNNLERPGRHATVAGWGETLNDSNPKTSGYPNRMQEAQVTIVSDSRADKLPWKPANFDFVPPLMIAAGGDQANQCSGDSGGPLFVRTSGNGDGGDDDENGKTNGGSGGKYTQIGIVSFGPQDPCLNGRPGVWTEVNAKPIASFIEHAADNGDGDGDNGDDKQLSN